MWFAIESRIFLFSFNSSSFVQLEEIFTSHIYPQRKRKKELNWVSNKNRPPHAFSSSSLCQFHQHTTSSFYAHRSQKRKKTVKSSSFFALSGSVCVKAAHRMLIKLTPSLQSPLIQTASTRNPACNHANTSMISKKIKESKIIVLFPSVKMIF